MWSTRIVVAGYVAAIVAANLLVAEYGPGVTVVNAFLLIGLDLAARDHLHDAWRGRGRAWRMAALIATAGAASYLLNPAAGRIAVASTVAFVAAAVVDWGVYAALRRWRYEERATASNVAGAGVDSLLFPALAFGWPLLWLVVAGQFAAKVGGGAVWTILLGFVRRRGVAGGADVEALAMAFAEMGGRSVPSFEDVARARESYAATRIAGGAS